MILSLPFHERWMTSQLCFLWNYQNEQWWCDWFELPDWEKHATRLELTYPNEAIKVLPDIVIVFGKQHEFLKARMTQRTVRRTHHVASDRADVNPIPGSKLQKAKEGLTGWKQPKKSMDSNLQKAWNVCSEGSLHSLLQANSFSRNWAMVWSPMYRWGMVGWIDSSHWTILHFLAENLDDFRRMWYDHSGSTHEVESGVNIQEAGFLGTAHPCLQFLGQFRGWFPLVLVPWSAAKGLPKWGFLKF